MANRDVVLAGAATLAGFGYFFLTQRRNPVSVPTNSQGSIYLMTITDVGLGAPVVYNIPGDLPLSLQAQANAPLEFVFDYANTAGVAFVGHMEFEIELNDPGIPDPVPIALVAGNDLLAQPETSQHRVTSELLNLSITPPSVLTVRLFDGSDLLSQFQFVMEWV